MGLLDSAKSLAKESAGYAKDSALGSLGAVEKAVIEIIDFAGLKPVENDAPKVSAGSGVLGGLGSFNPKALADAVAGAGMQIGDFTQNGSLADADIAKLQGIKRYRLYAQFNPDELHITGYGGEEVAIQDFDKHKEKPKDKPPQDLGDRKKFPQKSSRMAAANTRIDLSVKLIFDKTNVGEAFFAEKYSLGVTNLAKQGVKLGMEKMGKLKPEDYSVQKEVEALTATVRDRSKRLARFIWGDMIYEGLINSVNAEYVMFNVNGTPCRAFVNLGMVLLDKAELPSSEKHWRRIYKRSFDVKGSILNKDDESIAHL